jgi:hypothetical protein
MASSPRGKNALTRTTTLTLPPPLSGVLRPIGMTSDSRERNEGVDAEDFSLASDATPGNALASSAMFSNAALKSYMISRNRSRRNVCTQKAAAYRRKSKVNISRDLSDLGMNDRDIHVTMNLACVSWTNKTSEANIKIKTRQPSKLGCVRLTVTMEVGRWVLRCALRWRENGMLHYRIRQLEDCVYHHSPPPIYTKLIYRFGRSCPTSLSISICAFRSLVLPLSSSSPSTSFAFASSLPASAIMPHFTYISLRS